MKGKNDMRIKRKIGALIVIGMLGIIAFGTSVTADLDNLIWLRDDTGEDVSLSASYPNYDVGIGTDDPTAKLHVVGDVKIDSGDLNVGGAILFVDESSRKVGILTDNPQADLKVGGINAVGYGSVDRIAILPYHEQTLWKITARDDISNAHLDLNYGITTILTTRDDGNVGIGTPSPDNKLEILSTSTQLQLTHTDNTDYATFAVDSNGKLTIQTTGDNEDIEIRTGGFDDAIYIDDSSDRVGIGTSSPSARLHSLGLTEQLQLGYDASNYASFTVLDDGALTIQTSGTDEDIEIRTGGFDDAIYIDDNAYFVGIGTASPSARLHSFGVTEQLRLGRDTSNYASFTVLGDGALTIQTSGTDEDIEILTDGFDHAIFIDDSEDRVGIGTSIPAARLHTIGGTEQLRLGHDYANYASFTVLADGALTIQTSGTDEDIEIRTDGFDNAIYIDDDTSRVGIGIASPDNKLEILSTSTQLQLTHTDNTDYATFAVDSNGKLTIQTTGDDEDIEIRTGGFDNAIYIDDSTDRVGIGTATPGADLHVGDQEDTPGTAGTVDRIAIEPYASSLHWTIRARDTTTEDHLELMHGTDTIMTIDHNGNIGIGSETDPEYPLSIGNANDCAISLDVTPYQGMSATGDYIKIDIGGTLYYLRLYEAP